MTGLERETTQTNLNLPKVSLSMPFGQISSISFLFFD